MLQTLSHIGILVGKLAQQTTHNATQPSETATHIMTLAAKSTRNNPKKRRVNRTFTERFTLIAALSHIARAKVPSDPFRMLRSFTRSTAAYRN